MQTANASKLVGTTSWKEQFLDAMTVSGWNLYINSLNILHISFHCPLLGIGGIDIDDEDDDIEYEEDEDEDDTSPSGFEYVKHFLSLFWKICFSIIPPASKFPLNRLLYSRSLHLLRTTKKCVTYTLRFQVIIQRFR